MTDDRPTLDEATPDLTGRRVLVPGGTGGVGEGVVRGFLARGAEVVVPTRSADRAAEFRKVLAQSADDRLHLLVHDYSSFGAAERLVGEMERLLGGIDVVVAPIGGWWSGRTLTEITEDDWQAAFVDLATTHLAVLRAALPRIAPGGYYAVVIGDSAVVPVPGSGLVSMEQAALRMMQQVAAAESPEQRVFSFLLGAVRTRLAPAIQGVGIEQIGAVAAAIADAPRLTSRSITLHDDADVDAALRLAADHR